MQMIIKQRSENVSGRVAAAAVMVEAAVGVSPNPRLRAAATAQHRRLGGGAGEPGGGHERCQAASPGTPLTPSRERNTNCHGVAAPQLTLRRRGASSLST